MLKNLVIGLVMALPCWVLMLAGWGWSDRLSFFDSIPRTLVFIGIWPIFWAGAAARIRFGGSAKSESRIQAIMPVMTIGGFSAGLFLLPKLDRWGEPSWLLVPFNAGARIVGILLTGFGLACGISALLTLRHYFSPRIMVQEGHKLIRNGPYRWIRHPFYTGLALMALGVPLAFRSWVGLAALAAFFPFVAWRMTVEEGLLKGAFGTEYEDYMKSTWRLVPGIY